MHQQSTLTRFTGGAISASFVLFGGISVFLYRPWRRYVEQGRPRSDVPLDTLDEKIDVPGSNDVEHGDPGPGPSLVQDGTEGKEKEIVIDIDELSL